jgi:hypothetical protein
LETTRKHLGAGSSRKSAKDNTHVWIIACFLNSKVTVGTHSKRSQANVSTLHRAAIPNDFYGQRNADTNRKFSRFRFDANFSLRSTPVRQHFEQCIGDRRGADRIVDCHRYKGLRFWGVQHHCICGGYAP